MLDHPLGQGLDVGVGDGEGQEQFQELIVLQGPGASRQEALPKAGTVPVVMRFYRFFHHFFFSFTPARRQLQPRKTQAAAASAPVRLNAGAEEPGKIYMPRSLYRT